MPLRIFPSTKSTSTISLRPPISTSYLSRRSTIFSTCSVVIVFSSLINSMRSELRVIFRSSSIQRGVRTVRSMWATRWRTRRQKTADSGARRLKQDPGARWTPPISRSITSGASCRRTPESELSFRSFPQMRWMHCDRDCPTARSSTLTCHWSGFEPSRLRTNWP